MKKAFRYVITIYASFLGLLSIMIVATVFQFANNYLELKSMRNCARAVRDFEKSNARLPTYEEMSQINQALPDYGYKVDCNIVTERNENDDRAPKNWPKSGGWVLSHWRGSWNEYYSSWDDHYTLADTLSFEYYWGPLCFAPLLFGLLLALNVALREKDTRSNIFSTLLDPFSPKPDVLPKAMLARLKDTVERPLYNLWRAGMVVPLCFAAAYWIIIHVICGGDVINARSWCLLAGGGGLAMVSLLPSRRLGLKQKILWAALTMLVYPLLFLGAMFIGFIADIFHCFGIGWQ